MAKFTQIWTLDGTPHENVVLEKEPSPGTFMEVNKDYSIIAVSAKEYPSFTDGTSGGSAINKYDLINFLNANKTKLGISDSALSEFVSFLNNVPLRYWNVSNFNSPGLGYSLISIPVCDGLTPSGAPYGNPLDTPYGKSGPDITIKYGFPANDYTCKNIFPLN